MKLRYSRHLLKSPEVMASTLNAPEPSSYASIPMKSAPPALQGARPGDEVDIEATFKVTSVSEDTISGELSNVFADGESSEEVDDGVDLSDSAIQTKKRAPVVATEPEEEEAV